MNIPNNLFYQVHTINFSINPNVQFKLQTNSDTPWYSMLTFFTYVHDPRESNMLHNRTTTTAKCIYI